jgi:hypothetical protein
MSYLVSATSGEGFDVIFDTVGDAVLARHRRLRPPLELGLPPRADRDDSDLRQPPLDRRAEPQCRAERGQPPPSARRGDERVERSGQAAVGGQGQSPRPLTMLSRSCWPLGPSSSRRT